MSDSLNQLAEQAAGDLGLALAQAGYPKPASLAMKLRGAEISVRIIREALESATQALREQLEHARQEHEGVRVSLMQNLKEAQEWYCEAHARAEAVEQERDALKANREELARLRDLLIWSVTNGHQYCRAMKALDLNDRPDLARAWPEWIEKYQTLKNAVEELQATQGLKVALQEQETPSSGSAKETR
jgi:hypothetical protein